MTLPGKEGSASAFDWYQATVPEPESKLIMALGQHLGGVDAKTGPGKQNYDYETIIFSDDADEPCVKIWHGGPNGHPNVTASSDRAPALAGVLRALYPDHLPTRVHVAIDRKAPGLFEQMETCCMRLSDKYNLDCRQIINRDPDKGRTVYLGSPKSMCQVRCYEKGKKYLQETKDTSWLLFRDWGRAELDMKVPRTFREQASTLEPDAFWGITGWCRELMQEVVGMNAEPVGVRPPRTHDEERARRYLVEQYGNTIRGWARDLGEEEAARELMDRVFRRGVWASSERDFAVRPYRRASTGRSR